MVSVVYEFIPTITVGQNRYTHYPIRDMARHETEEILRHPSMRHMIILRTSQRAREENPFQYYVLSYIPEHSPHPVHVIITRGVHAEQNGDIRSRLPYPADAYRLLILPHHMGFQETREEPFPMEEPPREVERQEVPAVQPGEGQEPLANPRV